MKQTNVLSISGPTTNRPDNNSPISDKSVNHTLETVVNNYYPNLLDAVKACLAVFGAMSLKSRTKPLSLILETPSGYGKTAVLQMAFPIPKSGLDKFVYRSDRFTPKALVSHAANVTAEELEKVDLLPKLENKVLITKELAPILRGREEELQATFSILISVLDSKGFTSDSGMRGQRGYDRLIIFNWLGATTPLPVATHRLMSQLGTRLLFFEVPAIEPTEEELFRYAERDEAGTAETECQQVVNNRLMAFFREHPVNSVDPRAIDISPELLHELVRWSQFLVKGRSEIKYEKNNNLWEPIAALMPEGPFKVVNYFKELARGHALIHGRSVVTEEDLALVAHVAVSSIPGNLRPIVRELRNAETVDTAHCSKVCKVSAPTARRYLKELDLLGITELSKGSPKTNESNNVRLAGEFKWLTLT